MHCKQVKFVDTMDENGQLDSPLGGIGIFENDKLVSVICGECGGILGADDILWYEPMEWIDISDAIIGEN